MAIKIQSLAEAIGDNGLKMLVHGPAGAGKTVMGATAGEPTLIISAEAGLLSIAGAPSYIKVVTVSSIQDLYDVYEYLNSEHVCDWIVLDSVSEIAEVVLSYEKANNKDPRAAYGQLQEQMTTMLRKFRDLPLYNVLMTCKQQRVTDEYSGTTMYIPSLPGRALTQQISYMFDEVFALRVEKDDEGALYRVVQTSRDAQYEAKDRSGKLDLFEEPNLKKLKAKIIANRPAAGDAEASLAEPEKDEATEDDDAPVRRKVKK